MKKMMKKANNKIIKFIEIYEKNHSENHIKKCRFIPTCSQYSKECYKRFNFFKASFLTIIRLIKCNPLHKMAYDPVPEKNKPKFPTLEDTIIKYRIDHNFKN